MDANEVVIVKIALYARVSTFDKGRDVGMQIRDLRSYAEARGWEVFDEYAVSAMSQIRKKTREK